MQRIAVAVESCVHLAVQAVELDVCGSALHAACGVLGCGHSVYFFLSSAVFDFGIFFFLLSLSCEAPQPPAPLLTALLWGHFALAGEKCNYFWGDGATASFKPAG